MKKYRIWLKNLNLIRRREIISYPPIRPAIRPRTSYYDASRRRRREEEEGYDDIEGYDEDDIDCIIKKKIQKIFKIEYGKNSDNSKITLISFFEEFMEVYDELLAEDYSLLETEYEEAEISEEEKKSTKREDIRKCIRAGVIPDCYKDVIEKIEIKEVRKYRKKGKTETEEEEESSEAIRERAIREQKFIKDKNLGCVVCPMGEYLNAKSKRPNGNIRYANKLACKCCKNPCTKSKYKEVEIKSQ